MNNFLKRALTGIIYAIVIIASTLYNPYSYFALFLCMVGVGLWEFYNIVGHSYKIWHKSVSIIAGIYLYSATFFFASGQVSSYIFLPYILFFLFFLVAGLYQNTTNPVNEWGLALFAQFYCVGLLSFLNFIAFDIGGNYTPHFILMIFTFIWLNDTGAYLIGSRFGKHKLFPRISPLKSWEGFLGGLALSLLCSFVFGWYFRDFISWYHWIGLSIIIVLFGTWGDLIESLIKRTYDVKDSGKILPGHGGILDRLDSAILASPAVFLYLELFIRN